MRPRVAAVTINFGEPDDTLECVASLMASGYPALSVCVVDNGSPTDVVERLRRELPAGVDLVTSEVNLGFSGGNNVGIRRALRAGAEHVLLINNDATLAPGAIEPLLRAAERPGVGLVGGKILMATADPGGPRVWSGGGWWSPLRATGYTMGMGEPDRGQYDVAGPMEFLNGCLWLVPAATLRDISLLPEEFFLYLEDVDYCLTVRQAGRQVWYEPAGVAYHKVSRSHWHDRQRASPVLNYYSNRNRFLMARRWLSPWQRLVFGLYFVTSRVALAALRGDPSYCAGIGDGWRGRTGPRAAQVEDRSGSGRAGG